jgi:hypothetical protein
LVESGCVSNVIDCHVLLVARITRTEEYVGPVVVLRIMLPKTRRKNREAPVDALTARAAVEAQPRLSVSLVSTRTSKTDETFLCVSGNFQQHLSLGQMDKWIINSNGSR